MLHWYLKAEEQKKNYHIPEKETIYNHKIYINDT